MSVVISQNLGAGHRSEADRIARAALAWGTWMGGFVAMCAGWGASAWVRLLNAPENVELLAVPLLQVLALALILDAWNACMASVMRAHLRNRDTLVVVVCMHLTHVLLAWPLMTGWGEFPALGMKGFAVGLIISRCVGMVLYLWLWRLRLGLSPAVSDWWRVSASRLWPVLQIGLPGAAENLAWEVAFMCSVAAVGMMGTQALATQAYVLQFNMWILISGAAIGITVEMLVGHMIGARHWRQAHALVQRAQKMGFLITLCVACGMAWGAPWLMGWITQDANIMEEGEKLLWLSILLETGRTFNLIVIAALRATGDSRYPFYAGVGSMVLVLAGGSWLLGVYMELGLVGVWVAYAADEWIRGMLMWRRWLCLGWVPYAKSTYSRLRLQKTPANKG